MISRLAIFGASGDLTMRYLLPALVRLHETGNLPQDFVATAIAREDRNTESFREYVGLELAAQAIGSASGNAVLGMLEYRQADVTDHVAVSRALAPIDRPMAAYLALPPAVFAPAVQALESAGLPETSRIVLEKPFGEDLESARRLNDLLHQTFPEEAVFRVDHFLAEQTVQNILGLRLANRVFEPIWNHEHIEKIEIIWDETLALEGRASYYDRTGALEDMIQNHLLQLMCLVAIEPPVSLNSRDLHDRKVDLLRSVVTPSPSQIDGLTTRARYGFGRVGGREIPAYINEPGVDITRNTETLAAVTLYVENWRWSGVPFVLRTGKALGQDRREILIHFRPAPHLGFMQESEMAPNALSLTLDPDRLSLGVNITAEGGSSKLQRITLDAQLVPQELPPYSTVLLEILQGGSTLSIRDDEAEESWRVVAPILSSWRSGRPALLEYAAGTAGPPQQ